MRDNAPPVTADKKMNNKWNVKGAQARDIRLRVCYVNETCMDR
jgi:hypothetical protein